jgi:hypothetical protein
MGGGWRWDTNCPPSELDYVVPSRADDMSQLPGEAAVSLNSGMVQTGSMNYGGSRVSQMLLELVLQFSALCFRKKGKKKQKKKKKGGKTTFQQAGWVLLICNTWVSRALHAIKT